MDEFELQLFDAMWRHDEAMQKIIKRLTEIIDFWME